MNNDYDLNLGGGAGSSDLLKEKQKKSWVIHGKLFLGDSVWLSLDSLAYEDMLLENVPSLPAG